MKQACVASCSCIWNTTRGRALTCLSTRMLRSLGEYSLRNSERGWSFRRSADSIIDRNAGQPSRPGSVLSYTNTWRRTPLCGAVAELLAPVFKQYRTQGRSESFASVSQQLLATQTGLLVGTTVGGRMTQDTRQCAWSCHHR